MEAFPLSSKADRMNCMSHAELGVIVLAHSFQLQYKNEQARVLCEQINHWENWEKASGVLPLALTSLAKDIREQFQVGTGPKDWEQIQMNRLAGSPFSPVLLCGFGLIDADLAKSRIAIVLQEATPSFSHKRILDRSKEKFHLTPRQTEILQHLLQGLTNKEIATPLRITEQTVKEHIKHLLAKTGSTSRTSLVMTAVLCGLQHEIGLLLPNTQELARVTLPQHLGSQLNNWHFEGTNQNRQPGDSQKSPALKRNGTGRTKCLESQLSPSVRVRSVRKSVAFEPEGIGLGAAQAC